MPLSQLKPLIPRSDPRHRVGNLLNFAIFPDATTQGPSVYWLIYPVKNQLIAFLKIVYSVDYRLKYSSFI